MRHCDAHGVRDCVVRLIASAGLACVTVYCKCVLRLCYLRRGSCITIMFGDIQDGVANDDDNAS